MNQQRSIRGIEDRGIGNRGIGDHRTLESVVGSRLVASPGDLAGGKIDEQSTQARRLFLKPDFSPALGASILATQPTGIPATCAATLSLPRSFPALTTDERNRLWGRILIGLGSNKAVLEDESEQKIPLIEEVSLLLQKKAVGAKRGRVHDPIPREPKELEVEKRFLEAIRYRFPSIFGTNQADDPVVGSRGVMEPISVPPPESVVDPELQQLLSAHRKRSQARIQAINGLFKDYDDLTKCEYALLNEPLKLMLANTSLKAKCNYFPKTEKDGWHYYKWLRTFFRNRNPNLDPIKALNNIETKSPVKLFGEIRIVGGLHPRMSEIIKLANQTVESMKFANISIVKPLLLYAINVKKAGGFNPRPLNNCTNLSPHSLGKAIDIKPSTDPFWKGKKMKALDALFDHLDPSGKLFKRLSKPLLSKQQKSQLNRQLKEQGRQMGQAMEDMSKAVKDYLTEDEMTEILALDKLSWEKIDKLKETGTKDLTIVRHRLRHAFNKKELKKLSNNGLIDLPVILFAIMKGAGAKLGIEFKDGKDVMHFEVPAWANSP